MTQLFIHTESNCTAAECPQDEDPPSWIAACLNNPRVSNVLGQRLPVFNILYAEKNHARELNASYRNKDYATNVLSFPAELPDFIQSLEDGFTLGDLVICPSVVKDEALTQQKQLHHHFAHLTIHGFLHLLGFDHIEDDEAQDMETLEIEILDTLGIPNPYHVTSLSVEQLNLQQKLSTQQPEKV